jgi:hypothetical protein
MQITEYIRVIMFTLHVRDNSGAFYLYLKKNKLKFQSHFQSELKFKFKNTI